MNARKGPGANDGENRHRLGSPVDARSPFLAEQEQNRADQRSRVTDTDPKHEVDDRPTPEDRRAVSPHANPCVEEVQDADRQPLQQRKGDQETDHPTRTRLALGNLTNRLGDVVIGRITQHQRSSLAWEFDGVVQSVGNGE